MKRIVLASLLAVAFVVPCVATRGGHAQEAQDGTAPAAGTFRIPLGQKFILKLETAIHTRTTKKGDRVEFSTAADVLVENQVVLPDKSWVRGTIVKAKRAGRVAGRAEVQLRFDEVKLANGSTVPLHATITRVGYDPVDPGKNGDPSLKGESGTGGNIGNVVKAGAQGALIGVLAAGAKGAMYGSAAGAAISAAGMLLKRGPDLDLPSETMFEAQFDQPLDIPAAALAPPAPAVQSVPLAAPAAAVQSAPSAAPAAVPAADSPVSPPRPRLSRTDPPSVEIPPPVKPAETPPVAAPPPPETQPVENLPADAGPLRLKVNVPMVLVDVVVKDRGGHNMDHLAREDFVVYDDNVKQEVQSFSRDELPIAVALVIDRSGSEAPYISELRRIANRALMELKPEDKVALFSFAADVQRIEDLTSDRYRIADGLNRIRAGGGTDIIDALHEATVYLKRAAPDMRHAIILISDNQATLQPRTSEGETIRVAMESETVVYSLKTAGYNPAFAVPLPALFGGAGSVSKVTQETGGEIIDVANVASLDAALGGVISRLRMRYNLGYYVPNAGQGAFHAIVVRLDERHGQAGRDYFIHARRGYYSTGSQIR